MTKIISHHEYELKPGVQPEEFEREVRQADRLGLFELPGLVEFHFLRGVKGTRRNKYAALWVYSDRRSWEAIWGPLEAPVPPSGYPEGWKQWEAMLSRFLDRRPDRVRFTANEAWHSGAGKPTSS